MPEQVPIDLFATKGTEYILVILFLATLILYWRFLQRPVRTVAAGSAMRGIPAPGRWFTLSPDLYYHPGHSWALPDEEGIVTIGVDDFAQKMIGQPDSVSLPAVGATVAQGVPAFQFNVQNESVEMLSPIDGDVLAVNQAVLDSPELVNRDPYGDGWLMKVKSSRLKPNLTNLLQKKLATAWIRITENTLRQQMVGDLGTVMQDGGVPVSGIARSLSDDQWDETVKEYFLTGV